MSTVAATVEESGERRVRISGVRRFIADRMMESLGSSAQLSFHAEADVGRVLTVRAQWKQAGVAAGVEDIIIAALARAMAAQPELNGVAGKDEIVLADGVHVAIAIAAPDGLKTPVIRNADSKTVAAIADERRDFVARAFEKRLQVSEMKNGTVTVSNLGMTRVQHFTPILNSGQMILLGVGCVTPRLALDEAGTVIERKMLGLSLTVDHRVVDGEPAGRLLSGLCELLENFDPT